MARIPTHLSFGKHKGEAIADLATHSDSAGYLKWLLKQDTVDPYLAEACKQALVSYAQKTVEPNLVNKLSLSWALEY